MSRSLPPEFVRWLESRPHSYMDFIEHVDLSDVSLVDLDLACVWFAECTFDGAIVRDTDLFSCKFAGCSLLRTDLRGALLAKGEAVGSTFARASLAGANLRRVWAMNSDFRHADLTEADLSHMAALGCDLRQASLRGARFDGTHIYENTVLAGADLKGVTGTINGGVEINVGTPEAPLLLTDYAALEWLRDAGADLTWSRTPEEVAQSKRSSTNASGDGATGADHGT